MKKLLILTLITMSINAVAQNINSTSDYSGIISTGPNGGWGLSYNPSNVNQPGFGSDKFYGYFVKLKKIKQNIEYTEMQYHSIKCHPHQPFNFKNSELVSFFY